MFVVKQCGEAFNFCKVVILHLLLFFLFSPSWVRFSVFLAFFKKIVYVLNINIFAFIEEASTKLDVLINIVSKSFFHTLVFDLNVGGICVSETEIVDLITFFQKQQMTGTVFYKKWLFRCPQIFIAYISIYLRNFTFQSCWIVLSVALSCCTTLVCFCEALSPPFYV